MGTFRGCHQQDTYKENNQTNDQSVPRVDEATIQRVAAPPHTMVTTSTNPTAKQQLLKIKRTHQRITRNNTPNLVPPIQRAAMPPPRIPPIHIPTPKGNIRRSPRLHNDLPIIDASPPLQHQGIHAPAIITQEAINFIMHRKYFSVSTTFTPQKLIPPPTASMPDLEHFCAGVVHPIMGETITKYHKLANDKATREVWITAFGKELGSLTQGDNKTKTPGMNTIFSWRTTKSKTS